MVMTRSYAMQTEAEASRAIERLNTYGYEAWWEPLCDGHVVTVEGGPAVTVEEILIHTAPTARRVVVPQ